VWRHWCAPGDDDASLVWWAIRPSLEHPTPEPRAPDCRTCTRRSPSRRSTALARHLTRNPLVETPTRWRADVVENKCYDARHLQSCERSRQHRRMLDQLIDQIAPDAAALGCLPERGAPHHRGAGTRGHAAGSVEAHGRAEAMRRRCRR
jgi:carboxylate-amine ligase